MGIIKTLLAVVLVIVITLWYLRLKEKGTKKQQDIAKIVIIILMIGSLVVVLKNLTLNSVLSGLLALGIMYIGGKIIDRFTIDEEKDDEDLKWNTALLIGVIIIGVFFFVNLKGSLGI